MKKSGWIVLGVAATAAVGMAARHQPIVRDRYKSLADCRADWGRHGHECTEEGASSGGGGTAGAGYHGIWGRGGGAWLGPSYEQGDRPATARSWVAAGTDTVKRSGFGRTGARVSGGG
jgi:hypothetical protein